MGAGLYALLGAILGACIALVAAIISDRKLSFDLFSKRYEAYQAFMDATQAWIDFNPDEKNLLAGPNEFTRFWKAQAYLRILFSEQIYDKTKEIESALQLYLNAKSLLRASATAEVDLERHSVLQREYIEKLSQIMDRQEQFYLLVEPVLRQQTGFEWMSAKLSRWFSLARSALVMGRHCVSRIYREIKSNVFRRKISPE